MVTAPTKLDGLYLDLRDLKLDYEYRSFEDPLYFLTSSIGWKPWQDQRESCNSKKDICIAQAGLGLIGYFFWDNKRFEGLLPEGEAKWAFSVGHFLLNKALDSCFDEYLMGPINIYDVIPFWVDEETEDDTSPPFRGIGEKIVSFTDAEDDLHAGADDESDDDADNLDDVISRSARDISSSKVKDMPVMVVARSETVLEIDGYDY